MSVFASGIVHVPVRVRPTASPSGQVVAVMTVLVDRAVFGRHRQTGARAETGVHFVAERAAVDLFAAYERRVDGYPTSREPSSWFEFGFRLGTR
jgi:hypothetical protein